MSTDVTLTQLAADIAQLRQQIEITNQRLDMIYGAVTRLAESNSARPAGPPSIPPSGGEAGPPSVPPGGGEEGGVGHRQNIQLSAAGTPEGTGNVAREQPTSSPSSSTGAPLSARMMMDPGSMLDSLRQYALDVGLEIPTETVDHLKSNLPEAEDPVEDPRSEAYRDKE